jgi:HEAT repeat protein
MIHAILGMSMSDPALVAAIDEGLSSTNPEDVYDAIIDIGKQAHPELVDRVVPYLTSPTGFLREAALRTLVFHLRIPAYKADAIRMLDSDPDEGVREAAAMGLNTFAAKDPELLQHLLRVAVTTTEDDTVRAAAFLSALVAAGIERSEFPKARVLPDFDTKADWPLLARALSRAGIPMPAGVAERAARPR